VVAYERICKAPRYTTLCTDAERARVAQELASLTAARDEKSKALSRSVHALRDVAWWPVGPNQDEEAAAKYRELIQYVLQLNNAASELHQAYIKGAAQVAPAAAPPPPDPNARPLKRRRVSDEADDAQALSAADLAEMEQLRERLEELDERVGDLKNDLNVLETSDKDTIIAEIDARMEAFALETRSSGGGASSAELQTVEATVKTTNDHINALAPEVANMLVEGQRCREENDALKREIEKQSAQFTAVSNCLEFPGTVH
jgi:regulator of replication initiation timing